MNWRSGFIKDTAVLMTGTVVAQSIAFAFSVVVARQFSDVEFGRYAVFCAVLAVAGILSTGAYDRALVFAVSTRRLRALVLVVLATSLVVATLILVCGIALRGWLIRVTGVGISPFDVIALATATVCYACGQVFIYMSLRGNRPRVIATTKVGQSLVTGGMQSGLGAASLSEGLVAGHVLGVSFLAAGVLPHARDAAKGFNSRRWAEVCSTMRAMARYPRYVCPNELIDAASAQAPLVLISSAFSLSTGGQYAFAQRMLGAPAALVGQAVGQAFLQRIGTMGLGQREIRRLMFRVWGALALLGLLPFGAVLLWGDVIFAFVFGQTWGEAGVVAAVSAPLLLVRFISSPTSAIAYRLDMQPQQFLFSTIMAFARTAPVLFGFRGATLGQVIVLQTIGELAVISAFNLIALSRLARYSTGFEGSVR